MSPSRLDSAAVKLRLRARDEKDAPVRCALCHGGLEARRVACRRCTTLLHEECHAEAFGCPTLGCTSRRTRLVVATRTALWRRLWAEARPMLPWMGPPLVCAAGLVAILVWLWWREPEPAQFIYGAIF